MSTNTYNEVELRKLLNEINAIKPCGLTIVDTLGNMYQDDVREILNLLMNSSKKILRWGFILITACSYLFLIRKHF